MNRGTPIAFEEAQRLGLHQMTELYYPVTEDWMLQRAIVDWKRSGKEFFVAEHPVLGKAIFQREAPMRCDPSEVFRDGRKALSLP